MTWMSLGFVFLMAQAVVLGKPPIHKWHYAQIEVVFAATRDLATQGAAVQVLEKVALGQAATIDSEAERHVSLPAGTLKDPGFISPSVRELAVQRLGETGNPEVLQFLRAFQAEYAGPNDFGNRIWKAVQVAIRAAQFAAIAGTGERREFLEAVIDADDHSSTSTVVKHWAVDQICDGGMLASSPVAARWLRYAYSEQGAEDEVADCNARIRIVSSHTNRAKAIGSALSTDQSSPRIIRWALNQLESMDTPDAYAQLRRFAGELDNLPLGRQKDLAFMLPELREVLSDDRRWKR